MSKQDKRVESAQVAKRQARDYKTLSETPAEATPPQRPPLTSEQEYQDIVGRRIEEAMRAGAFDNLRGKGKPLNLQRNPFVPEEMEMAYAIMERNQIAPEWIDARAAILRAVANWRERLRLALAEYRTTLGAAATAEAQQACEQRWQAERQALSEEMAALNKQILIVNLKQPIARLEIFKLLLDEELARAGFSEG
jgi:hypothetical protein